jgi:colanic acid/amylovoran biosynthesis glycosyltransferase
MAAHFAQVTFTFTAHAKDIFHDDVRPDDLQRKCGSAAAVVTVSDFNKAYLQAAMPSVASKVRRVYNGMDLGLLPFRRPDDRRPLIVAVGRLIEKKGFGDLIAACTQLVERGVSFECAIIGAGELGPELVADTERRRLTEVVRFLGPLPQRDVLDYIRQAAVMAAPCVVGADGNRDGLPTVLLEAMALGTPCVSTDVTGIPELVRDGDTGLLVAQHDPSGLAVALSRLLADSALRVAIAHRARRLIEQEFDADRSAERLRAIWTEHVIPMQESAVAVVA